MILGQVSYLDCLAFVVFLAPQLLLNVGVWGTFECAVSAIPNICKTRQKFTRITSDL
jgi:hypothetical protein